jgi:hypothetical protein
LAPAVNKTAASNQYEDAETAKRANAERSGGDRNDSRATDESRATDSLKNT